MAIDPLAIAPGRGEGMAAILPDSTNLLPLALQDVKTREAAEAKAKQDVTKSLAKLENKHIWDRDQEKFNNMLQETWNYALAGDPNDRAFQSELAKRKQQLIEYADKSNMNKELSNKFMMDKDWGKAFKGQKELYDQFRTTPEMDFPPTLLEDKMDLGKWIQEAKTHNINEAEKRKQEYSRTGKISGSDDDFLITSTSWKVKPELADKQVQQLLYDPIAKASAEELMNEENAKGAKYTDVYDFGKRYLSPLIQSEFAGQTGISRIPEDSGAGRRIYTTEDIGTNKAIKKTITLKSGGTRETTTTVQNPLVMEPTTVDISITPTTYDYSTGLPVEDKGVKKATAGEISVVPVVQYIHQPVPDDWRTNDSYKGKPVVYEPMVSLSYPQYDKLGTQIGDKSILVPLSEIKNTPGIKGKKIKVDGKTISVADYYEKLAKDINASEGIQIQSTQPKPATKTAPKTGGGAKPQMTKDEWNKQWAALPKGQTMVGLDGKTYTKK